MGDLSPTDKEDSPYGRVELSFHTEAGTCQNGQGESANSSNRKLEAVALVRELPFFV
jgi:hypothetical protein